MGIKTRRESEYKCSRFHLLCSCSSCDGALLLFQADHSLQESMYFWYWKKLWGEKGRKQACRLSLYIENKQKRQQKKPTTTKKLTAFHLSLLATFSQAQYHWFPLLCWTAIELISKKKNNSLPWSNKLGCWFTSLSPQFYTSVTPLTLVVVLLTYLEERKKKIKLWIFYSFPSDKKNPTDSYCGCLTIALGIN